jgi:hypothetical protein
MGHKSRKFAIEPSYNSRPPIPEPQLAEQKSDREYANYIYEAERRGAIAALERVRKLVLDAGYEHYDVGSVGMAKIRNVIDAEIERIKEGK